MARTIQHTIRIEIGLSLLATGLFLIGCSGANLEEAASENSSSASSPSSSSNGSGSGSSSSNEGGNTGTGEILNGQFRFIQPANDVRYSKLDILFVIDTSGSISNSQLNEMINGIDRFIDELPADGDYHLGLILAHAVLPANGGRSGELYQTSREPLILQTETDSRSEIRADMRRKLDRGNTTSESATDGGEAGLLSLQNAIQGQNLMEAQAAGFFREEAGLAVVFLADENDTCSRYLSPNDPFEDVFFKADPNQREIPAYRRYCTQNDEPVITHTNTLARLKAFKGDRPLLVSGIIYTENSDPNELSGENERGWGYEQLIQDSKGLVVDLSFGDQIAKGLEQIGELSRSEIAGLQTSFELPHTGVIEDTIVVKVDGETVAFQFIDELSSVVIPNAGDPESAIEILYQYVD